MFQRDYILRMIEMMGDFMRRITELMDELSQKKLMDEACRRNCGLPLETIELLSAESLEEMLGQTPRLFASELLYIRATTLPQALEDAEERLLKSFRLLISLNGEGALCELRALRAQELKLRLLERLNDADLWRCAMFLSQGEAYADMEDAIFEAAERAPDDVTFQTIVEQGEAMLRSASHADATTLAFARTSAEELCASAEELLQKTYHAKGTMTR